jgi:hypothetical protein
MTAIAQVEPCDGPWDIVFRCSDHTVVLYNRSLHQLRAIHRDPGHRPETIPWASPRSFQLLGSLFSSRHQLPPSLSDYLVNGYFDRFFPRREPIARGGSSCVFHVQHELAGIKLADYAVKIIPVGEFSWLRRVIGEVRLLERLGRSSHPLILSYKHCWIEEYQTAFAGPTIPCLFILMEYSELGNLEDYLHDQGASLDEQSKWQIFLNVTTGLKFLHDRKALHRDLKLSNVLLFHEQ